MILDILRGQFTKMDLIYLLLRIPTVLIALSFHESAHGWVAEKLGDNTARWNGRITMNPVNHFDPLGMLCMLLFGFGWAKPVPINTRNFKNPKKGMAITGLAGPVSNLILGFFGVLFFRIFGAVFGNMSFTSEGKALFCSIIITFFYYFGYLNICLAVFNLIPVPPFDGSRIFYFILPDKYYFSVMKYERIIMYVTMILLFTGFLDGVLSTVTGSIFNGFNNLIGLVPFL